MRGRGEGNEAKKTVRDWNEKQIRGASPREGSAQWEILKNRLLTTYDAEKDSLRFYFLGSNWQRRVEHHGKSGLTDLEAPLIV